LRSWAFATSPHGLGMSTSESWQRTPREFKALERVYLSTLERWAIERAQFANAHFKRQDSQTFSADDFLDTPTARVRKRKREKERFESMLMKREADSQTRRMIAARSDPALLAVIEAELPAWARMTDGEKRQRGMQ
jgi:hypothetical protein